MRRIGILLIAAAVFVFAAAPATWATKHNSYKILHAFTGGNDGGLVASGLVLDGGGNLYGATYWGGTGTGCGGDPGCGVAFQLTPRGGGRWSETVLFDFNGQYNTGQADGGLIMDGGGDLYGTALGGPNGVGTIFELTPGGGGWNFSTVYARGGGCLILDQTGNLYGCIPPGGIGELSPGSDGWTYTDLSDETSAVAPLIWDAKGNLYGTDPYGGNQRCSDGCGTAFQLAPNGDGTWTYHVLHYFGSFQNDGQIPVAGLVLDAAGNAYGATWDGGPYGCGIIFKLEPSAEGSLTESILYNFRGPGGCGPLYTLAFDSAGNLYGMAQGGDQNCGPCGVIFKLAPQKSGKWKYSVLHTFHGTDGAFPYGVILDSKGNIFGTTENGGKYNLGVAFEITPDQSSPGTTSATGGLPNPLRR